MNNEFISEPQYIVPLLKCSEIDDINILTDYITDSGKGRLTLSSDICNTLIKAKNRGSYTDGDLNLIVTEIKKFGGNTLTNMYRDARTSLWGSSSPIANALDKILPDVSYAVDYDEIVKDVASHLKVNFNKSDSLLSVEDGILKKILKDSFEKMSVDERKEILEELGVTDLSLLGPAATAATLLAGKMAGFATFKIALIVANAMARSILGKGLSFATNRLLTKTIAAALGPIGWVITGLWTIADMASPAFRVTVPCVVQISYMRQKAILKVTSVQCSTCNQFSPLGSKFCADCGSPL